MRLNLHHLASLLSAMLLPAVATAAPQKSLGEGMWEPSTPAGLRVPFSDGQLGRISGSSVAYRGGGLGGMLYEAEGGAASDKGGGTIYNWAGPPRSEPDWDGAKRDALYFLGWQFAAIGVLYVMPESVSGWSQEDKDQYSISRWCDNVTNPHWDDDTWWVNYVLHPYWGAAYYIRARERGLGEGQAFWFSALNSALYEYGPEAFFEPASYTDLLVTPIFGWALGEYVFVPWRERVRANPEGIGTTEKILLTLTDPLGVLYGATDHALGIQTDFALGPMPQLSSRGAALGRAGNNPWQDDLAPPSRSRDIPWGVQWQVSW